MHDEHVVAGTGVVADGDARHTLDQVDNLRLDAVDYVDLTTLQRRRARRRVVDDDDFDLVGMAHLVALPVVGEALADMAHAGLVDLDLVGAGADAGIGLVLTAIRLDDQVIVAEQIGKVGVGLLQGQHHFLAVDLYGVDALHIAQRAGLRLLVRMALERRRHVLGRHRLAVVEFDAVADLQRPDLGVVRRADFLGDAVLELALRRQLDDHFAPALAEGEGHLGHHQGRVEAVGRFTADQAGLQRAALDGAGGAGSARKQRVGEGRRDTERGGAAKEVATAELSGRDATAEVFEFVRHYGSSLWMVRPYGRSWFLEEIMTVRESDRQDRMRHAVA